MRSILVVLPIGVSLGCASPREKMHRACREGDVEVVEKLVTRGFARC